MYLLYFNTFAATDVLIRRSLKLLATQRRLNTTILLYRRLT